ncbi:SIR2 family protein [Pseudarthrobacter sp. AB1]|uniref:SIR2 family NAD-dependent protein deacylase n=1 Tax=Pseudarthrobacter sp. AB1 TaxID=2138309 RepID=UPI00186B830C|nr:SIR2 family protein [Pseudarthrobacter sp. AB1]MBE4717299.1 hypothetical protein [Pseudarthrobacter sp. AB1]
MKLVTAPGYFVHGRMTNAVLSNVGTDGFAGTRRFPMCSRYDLRRLFIPCNAEFALDETLQELTLSAPCKIPDMNRDSSPTEAPVPHVFVAMADILHLNCDAWLLPTSTKVRIRESWTGRIPFLDSYAQESAGADFRDGSKLAQAILGWTEDAPLPVLTSVTVDNLWPSGALKERIHAFAEAAVDAIAARARPRTLPLLAVPFFGTEGGGADRHLGAMLTALLEAASSASQDYNVDFVIVLRDKSAFSLAQKLRRAARDDSWGSLRAEQLSRATELGEEAKKGRLVPFLGAGVSVSAGSPSWRTLLKRLTGHVDLGDIDPVTFRELPLLDQAGILERLFERQRKSIPMGFREAVCAEVTQSRYGLAPALISTMPSSGAITLNYDALFEDACRDAELARTVIPDDHPVAGDRWLLKLHGTVTKPESIVLTRDDYLDHNTNRQALSALVKAHLVTHHMLFVGFGLEDDHFHEIIHDVRRALPKRRLNQPRPFGTVLSLDAADSKRHIWQGQLDFISVTDDARPQGPVDEESAAALVLAAGRKLEIFLDALGAFSSDSHSYLLAPLYTEGLSHEERGLRQQLLALAREQRPEKSSEIWSVLEDALVELGWESGDDYLDG